MFSHSHLFILLITILSVVSQEPPESSEEKPHKPTYDQRQTGKYNVNFNIKDVNIFTLEGDTVGGGIGDGDSTYDDYEDYDYDTAHYTINPIFGALGATTKKPTTTDPDAVQQPQKLTTLKPTASFSNAAASTHKPSSPTTTVRSASTPHRPNAQLIYILRPNQTAETIALDYQDADQIPVQVIHGRRGAQKFRNGKPHRHNLRRPGYGAKQGTIKYLSQTSDGLRVSERCKEGEFRDRSGSCRARRTSGIKRLMNFISSFTKHDDNEDDN